MATSKLNAINTNGLYSRAFETNANYNTLFITKSYYSQTYIVIGRGLKNNVDTPFTRIICISNWNTVFSVDFTGTTAEPTVDANGITFKAGAWNTGFILSNAPFEVSERNT